MAEYEKEFSLLSKCAPEPVLTKTFRCRLIEDGLKESIKRYLMVVTSLQVVNFYQLMQAAMQIEKSEMMNRERKTKRKFSKGSSLQVKQLESLRLNQYIILLLKVESRDLQRYWVLIGALHPNKGKGLNACTATNIILVLANG